jgi:hypothetical protein
VRRHDRERHVVKRHPGKNSEVGESSQETLVPSDMEVQEGDVEISSVQEV